MSPVDCSFTSPTQSMKLNFGVDFWYGEDFFISKFIKRRPLYGFASHRYLKGFGFLFLLVFVSASCHEWIIAEASRPSPRKLVWGESFAGGQIGNDTILSKNGTHEYGGFAFNTWQTALFYIVLGALFLAAVFTKFMANRRGQNRIPERENRIPERLPLQDMSGV